MRSPSPFLIMVGREVESYFFAPLMYLVLAVFLVLNGYAFHFSLQDMQGNVDATVRSFLGGSILFWINIVFVPPLLTMRLIAEERRSGTLEGLMTAPVTDVAVVVAKFLGALAFYFALWAPSIVYLLVMKSYGALPDTGILATSYVGIFLLGVLMLAMGVLASAVSPNQVVAAILGVTMNMLFVFGPLLSVSMPRGPLRTAIEHISVLFHFQNSFAKGVLDTGIISVYIAGAAVCLFLAVRALESRRWS